MSSINFFFTVLSAIVLFLHGLESLSKEMHLSGGEKLKSRLSQLTSNRWSGFFLGLIATLIIQSSTAVTSMTVAFVDAGVIALRDSMAVMLGAKIGTTATAWMVSFKLTDVGPVFIVVGAVLGFVPNQSKALSKAIFYFGFILFSLDLISGALQPLRDHPLLQQYMSYGKSSALGILAGAVVTVVVQSSSVTTGLAVLFAQQGILPAVNAIPLIIGANLGTTTTALFVSMKMTETARLSARMNVVITTLGVLMFLPFTSVFSEWVVSFSSDPATAVAWSHLIFNMAVVIPVMIFLDPLTRLMTKWLS